MWIGAFNHNLDEKNRCVLPSKFRQEIKDKKIDKFFITRGLEGCVSMYEESEWKKLTDKLEALAFTKKDVRQFNRIFFGSAVEVIPDGQGRFVVPDHLREHAQITSKEIVVTGVSDRIEIWSKERWNSMYETNRENFETMAENLFFDQ